MLIYNDNDNNNNNIVLYIQITRLFLLVYTSLLLSLPNNLF